ncbi:MAG: YgiQ family radical SAM protein [Clostridiales Family XIII bacterium]|nr:YgiQ family radical SAM protein [Clostridiales Family XIII bacterium]
MSNKKNTIDNFLTCTSEEMRERGLDCVDFVLVSGDPYIDHPSFGTAIIGRLLESRGYSVAVLAQPDWTDADAFKRFGRPRLGFLITAGSVDSMVANYTAAKHKRRKDSLSPGGQTGRRPDRALIVYTNGCKAAFPGCPVILGGIEASLRRLAHYDYWSDKVRRSVLLDSKADILVYGMGERAIVEVADALADGFAARDITWIAGTAFRAREETLPADALPLPAFADVAGDFAEAKEAYCRSYVLQYENGEHIGSRPLAEAYEGGIYVLQNPPQAPLSRKELDNVYALPFCYDQHPVYSQEGCEIPALHEIRFSIAHVRGCFGNCAFCAITAHQGRIPTARSRESVVAEAEKMASLPGFYGYIHDVGGPTANIRGAACAAQEKRGSCKQRDCLWPQPCKNLRADHTEYTQLLRAVRGVPGVKKAFVRSGIRYDLVLADGKGGPAFLKELVGYHVSGILKTAPEHVNAQTLACMRKPGPEVYERFEARFNEAEAARQAEAQKAGGKCSPQYLLPYYISAHPGCDLASAAELTDHLKAHGFVPDQIQDFYPTPGTLATCMYHTGMDPFTGAPVYVPGKNPAVPGERALQRALLHEHKKENKPRAAKARRMLKHR